MSNSIFIIGAPRSGTTLLRLILTTHSGICIPPESLFFSELESKYGNTSNLLYQVEEFLNDIYSERFPKFREWNISRNLLLNNLKNIQNLTYAQAVETVYQTYRQQFDPVALIWGDKNPCHIHCLDKVWRHFPESSVILIVRDFRACYNSVQKILKNPDTENIWSGPRTLEAMIRQFSQVIDLTEKYHKKCKQFYLIYYEELVRQPLIQLTRLCEWIGVNFEHPMLKFYQKNIESSLVLPSQIQLNPNTFKPINTERINAWQHELSFTELKIVELMTKNLKY